ncbi:MAG: hypothetical protein ACRD2W_00015 [Acidimicrobiales bacterium]
MKKITTASVLVAGAVLVAAAVAALPTRQAETQISVGAPAMRPAAQVSVPGEKISAADLARNHANPTYLPEGAASLGGRAIEVGWVEAYSLPGVVNSRTLPESPDQYVKGSAAHPATRIVLSQYAQDFSTFQGVDPRIASVSTITVMGVPATVVVPLSGYGTHRISWVRDGVSYDLQTQRLYAGAEGTSGIPIEELIRVALSVS